MAAGFKGQWNEGGVRVQERMAAPLDRKPRVGYSHATARKALPDDWNPLDEDGAH